MNDELLIKFLLNETTAEESRTVQSWISANAENRKYFQQFERIWNESTSLAESSNVDEEQAWQNFKQRVNEKQANIPLVKKINPPKFWLRIAAAFAICFGAWLVYEQFGGQYTNLESQDLVLTQELPDGSSLVLNKNTHISYAKNFKTNRRVEIEQGEVFFNVAHDRSYPFVIEINNVKVEVVGTSFNIKKVKKGVEVIVETGIVKVTEKNKEAGKAQIELRLIKGESVLLANDEDLAAKKQTEDELYNYYRTQLFIANNTPLDRLVAILSEAYGTKISLHGSLKNERISTTLPFKYALEKNLDIICETLDLKMQRNQNEIVLSKK